MKQDMNNFYEALKYEDSQMSPANKFYESLGFTNIRRCRYETPTGRKNQEADIDLKAKYNGKIIKISEKFRSIDYGDVMVELEDKFEGSMNKNGWIFKSKADYIFYHTPKALYIIPVVYLRKLAEYVYDTQWDNFKDKILKLPSWRTGPSSDPNYPDVRFKHIPTTSMGRKLWEGLQVIIPLRYIDNIKIIHK